ncbi:hypothetical protein M514_06905 [Trichuris suis]|uniref:Uncharacterized protein n=1 Tax=Trichuris suis TaxID=68888 RepID=A0A085M4P6_9BILA|nr:hypothetical protein M513_06905 [Trichuris suis]KFD70367.1 hypothetical protein M514_06905 [Trichuris suis]
MSGKRTCVHTALINSIYPVIGCILVIFVLLWYAYRQYCDVGKCYKKLKEPITDALNASLQATIPRPLKAQHNNHWKGPTQMVHVNMTIDAIERYTFTIENDSVHVVTYEREKYASRSNV